MNRIAIINTGMATGLSVQIIAKLKEMGQEVVVINEIHDIPVLPIATNMNTALGIKDINGPFPEPDIFWTESKKKAQWKRETKGRPRK